MTKSEAIRLKITTESGEREPTETVEQKLQRLVGLQKQIWAMRPTYDAMDALVLELAGEEIPAELVVNGQTYFVNLVDNFQKGNTAWGLAPVKRYEAKIRLKCGMRKPCPRRISPKVAK